MSFVRCVSFCIPSRALLRYGTPRRYLSEGANFASRRRVSTSSPKRGYNEGAEDDLPYDGEPTLLKPFLFTVAFSACSLGLGEVLHRRKVDKQKRINPSPYYKGTDEYRYDNYSSVFWPICLANVAVFMAWRARPLQPVMMRYFLTSPTASGPRCWPMLLAAFSHMAPFHLLTNMYVLSAFSDTALAELGSAERFYGFYMASAVISSLASFVSRVAFSRPGASLGASGAVMAVLGFACMRRPETEMAVLGMFPTASSAQVLFALMATDAIGLFSPGSMFDHAAHLGGSIFGIIWALLIPEQKRFRKS